MTVAGYLIARLKQAGLAHLFAVPGDYAGPFLVALDATPGIARIANINELGSGYAADGYARFRGIGAACVQYGVGTFSVLNCTAGSFVERAAGGGDLRQPEHRRIAQLEHSEQILFHHSTGDLRADQIVFQNVTVASEILRSGRAGARPDRSRHHRHADAPAADLSRRAQRRLESGLPAAGRHAACARVQQSAIRLPTRVDAAWRPHPGRHAPVLWAGVEIRRFGLQDTLQQIVDASGLYFTTTSLGKTVLDESQPQFIGTYAGPASPAAHSRRDESHGLPDRARHDHHRRLPRHHGQPASAAMVEVNDEEARVG